MNYARFYYRNAFRRSKVVRGFSIFCMAVGTLSVESSMEVMLMGLLLAVAGLTLFLLGDPN